MISTQNIVQQFKTIVGEDNAWTDATDLHTYSYDAAVVDPVQPGLIVAATTTEALGQAVTPVQRKRPAIDRPGGRHQPERRHRSPSRKTAWSSSPTGLKSILEINEADMYAVVQPGVVTAKLAAAVEAKGLFYPPDPGSQAVSTIGGNVAENAGGLRGLKYGVTRDYVMGVSFFDVEGNLVKSGSRTVKCATGYNLTGLMVGSEGTLGVFRRNHPETDPSAGPPQGHDGRFRIHGKGLGNRGGHHCQPHRSGHP
jgi:glycolate oxidase